MKATNLLDFLKENEATSQIHKLEGMLDMKNFVIRDSINISHIDELIIYKAATISTDKDFAEAIEEFHMMYDARVTVIAEGMKETDPLFKALLGVGVGNIIISDDLVKIREDIVKCLSVTGLERYEASERATPKHKGEHYKFVCKNVRIAVIGSQNRIGATTMALGLVNWLDKVGATVCYIENNASNILPYVSKEYGLTGVTDSFKVDNMEFTRNVPKEPCNFEVFDFGNLSEKVISNIKHMDEVILTCGVKIYELPYTVMSLKQLSETDAYIFPTFLVDGNIERYENIFVNEQHTMLESVYQPDFMDSELAKKNYKKMIERHIAAE